MNPDPRCGSTRSTLQHIHTLIRQVNEMSRELLFDINTTNIELDNNSSTISTADSSTDSNTISPYPLENMVRLLEDTVNLLETLSLNMIQHSTRNSTANSHPRRRHHDVNRHSPQQ